jgi:hypothetical protein
MKKIYVLLSAMLFGTGVFAQGETCATAVPIGVGTHTADGPNSGNGAVNGNANAHADWYSYTPTCDGTITIGSCFGGNDTEFAVYGGACGLLGPELQSGSGDDCELSPGGNGWASEGDVAVTGGTTYLIEWYDEYDDFGFDWSLDFTPAEFQNVAAANETPVSVDISWDAIGAETSWDVEYGPVDFPQGAGTTITVGGGLPLTTLTGLDPEVAYHVYITETGGTCGFTSTVTAGVPTFTTLPLCPVPTAPMSTVGSADASMSWTVGGTEVEWDVEYGEAGFVLGSGDVFEDNTGSNPLLTPPASLDGSTDYHWYVRAVCQVAGNEEVSYWVGPNSFTTDPSCATPTNFTAVLVDTFEMQLNWDVVGLATGWSVEYGEAGFAIGSGTSFDVSVSNDTLIDGLDPETTYDFYLTADCAADGTSTIVGPISATTGVACTQVSGLTSNGQTINSINVNWTPAPGNMPMETEWNMVYGVDGFDPLTEGTTENVTSLPYTITGLDAGTDYQYYVEAVCGTDTNSVWVGPRDFSTLVSCDAPSPVGTGSMNITNTAANLIFQSDAAAFNIEWGSAGFTPEMGEEFGMVSNTPDNPYYATGLNASSTYEYYVQAICGAGDESTWAGPFAFNTLLSNDMPCNAIEITVDAADTNRYINNGATVDMNEPSLGAGFGAVDASTWFMFTAPASGVVTVSTSDVSGMTTNSTDIGVFSADDCGIYSTYTLVGASETPGAGAGARGAELTLCGLTGGQTYYVMVDPRFGTQDDFMIAVNSDDAAVAGTAVTGYSCSADGSLDLFDFVTGFSNGNGSFYFPDATQTDPDLIFAGDDGELVLNGLDPLAIYGFDYVVGSGCNADTVSIEAVYADQPFAGIGDTVTTCISQNVDLGDHLMGVVATGGVWSDDDNATGLVNGVFFTGAVAAGTYNFTYLLDNGLCADSSVVTVIVEACLGVDANEVTSLEVYPNPVNNELTIANLNVEGQAVITVVDVQGKVVMTNAINNVNGNYNLDMSKLENGVYVVTVRTNDSVENVRVIKQ